MQIVEEIARQHVVEDAAKIVQVDVLDHVHQVVVRNAPLDVVEVVQVDVLDHVQMIVKMVVYTTASIHAEIHV